MSERVIAIKGTSFAGSRDIILKPDPEAPSVAEVVEILREAMEWSWLDDDAPAGVEARIHSLIARLEDA